MLKLKALDKQPTDANLDEVAQNDVLNRNQFIADFIRLLASIEGNYSIALDGRWGVGKTFFVKQTERVIKDFYNVKTKTKDNEEKRSNQKTETNPKLHEIFKNFIKLDLKEVIAHHMMTFYYDAWRHDIRQDALLSLVYEILNNLPSINPLLKFKQSKTKKCYDGMIIAAKGIINHLSGIKIEEFNNIIDDIFLGKQKQEDLESFLKDFFENLISDKSTRLVIFIDELDRCKPDYSVQLLEQIKHYMTFDRITFVFAVNIEQLQHTIKRYYGDDFDASSYLDRFFDYHVTLPEPSLEQKRNVFSFGKNDSLFADWSHYLADEFNFTLRERSHFFELIKQTLQCEDDNIFTMSIPSNIDEYFKSLPIEIINEQNINDRLKFTLVFLKFFVVPIGLALRIKNITKYYSFIDGNEKNELAIVSNYFNQVNVNKTDNNFSIFCKKINLSKTYERVCLKHDFRVIVDDSYCFLSQTMFEAPLEKIYDKPNFWATGTLLKSNLIQREMLTLLSSFHR